MKATTIISYTILVSALTLLAYLSATGQKPIPQSIGCKLTDCYVEKKSCDLDKNQP